MAYRDVTESLRAYRDRIANDLADARRARDEAAERAEKVRVLEAELAETDQLISHHGGRRRHLPQLEDVAVAAPCSASWDEMVGDEHVRFCRHCEKNVYNLSSMSREESEALLAARDGNLCVRLYRRKDGTVLTEDCPVGVKRRRRCRVVAGVVGGGLFAAGAALAGTTVTVRRGSPVPTHTAVMGSIATPEPPPEPTAAPTTTTSGHWTTGVARPRMPPPTKKR